MLVKRYLIPSDYPPEESWRLVEWCRSVGADEFTVECISTDSRAADVLWAEFEAVVKPLSRPSASRERMSGRTADDLTRVTPLWTLSSGAIDALREALPGGLFQYDPLHDAWFEDPVIYRDGDLMLGVLSHEAFAMLRVTELEIALLAAAGFPSHESLPRIG
ncbi:MAG TPA: hypothetical protein VLJ83_07035 [Gemmatimonadaceae bacterium]|nr:hypothetical protein [Gemmatimonadaceae bacterium]